MSDHFTLPFNIKDSGIKFELHKDAVHKLSNTGFQFGFPESGFGQMVYYRTYSRIMSNGQQEQWLDTVLRVINGVMTIRKWWFVMHHLRWNEYSNQQVAYDMADSMLKMHWLPPGRGLWAMGSDYMYERGSASLYNCAFIEVNDLVEDSCWLMDMSMNGVGVGFGLTNKQWKLYTPSKRKKIEFVVPDSREGWVESVRLLLKSYTTPASPSIKFDYSKIRKQGTRLQGFGGTASGPAPLIELHERIALYCEEYQSGVIDSTRLVADFQNAIGACVVAGNIRRSAEIALGDVFDDTFMNLKNYNRFPDRADIGWMSNNSVRLSHKDHFDELHRISNLIVDNGEPGILNMKNIQKYARLDRLKPDLATGINPCAEIPLESFEVCNLSEVFPTRCKDKATFFAALKAATLYSSTVSLYPTHSAQTNEVVARNRRIGVSISGIAQWIDTFPTNSCIRWMKEGYDIVEAENKRLASEAGVVPSVRLTTVKPSGSISQVAGVTSGMHFPAFEYALRRIIVSKTNSLYELLLDAGYRCEPHIKGVRNTEFNPETMKVYDKYNKSPKDGEESYNINTESDDTVVFEVPIQFKGARPATNVSAWEQFSLLAMLQRNWADNSVSATIYFNKNGEHKQINHMLSQFVSQIKSVSVLPHSDLGAYNQMPYEGITKDVFEKEASRLKPIMWDRLKGSDGIQEKYCTNDTCVLQ